MENLSTNRFLTKACLVLSIAIISLSANSATVKIDPVSDGSIYTCDTCNPVHENGYLTVAGYIQGVVKFSTEQVKSNPVESAFLSVNPYGLPIWDNSIDVYGYLSDTRHLTSADGNAGTFLGTWHLPENLGYGEDAFFDVTDFISQLFAPVKFQPANAGSAEQSYIAFNLRSDTGSAVFSSLEYNYGHPSQLAITPVPLPGAAWLFAAGLISTFSISRRRRFTV